MARQDKAKAVSTMRQGSRSSTVTPKGQTTIPAEIRREIGLGPGDKVIFSIEGQRIILEKIQSIGAVWNNGQSAQLNEWDDPEQDVYNDAQSMGPCPCPPFLSPTGQR